MPKHVDFVWQVVDLMMMLLDLNLDLLMHAVILVGLLERITQSMQQFPAAAPATLQSVLRVDCSDFYSVSFPAFLIVFVYLTIQSTVNSRFRHRRLLHRQIY